MTEKTSDAPPNTKTDIKLLHYRSDIDGLRAIAVLSVVIFHAAPALVPGGFIGVDIFFVISGYLITSILIADLSRNAFSIATFYDRRIRRIFPALFTVLAVSSLAAIWLLPPFDLAKFGRSLVATTLFSSNILFWRESGYFDGSAEIKPLLHTWSLAVEEQFYIFFPLLLLSAWKLRCIGPVLWSVFVGSLALSIYGASHFASASFYLLPSRAWELLIGSLLAVGAIPSARGRFARETLAVAGLGLMFAGFALIDPTTPFPGAAALLPCVGAGLIILAGRDGAPTQSGRLLSLAPVRFFGLISYSLYLWHWPVLVFARYATGEQLSAPQAAVAVAASIVLATLSWRLVEQPFRHRRSGSDARAGHARVLSFGAAMLAAFFALGSSLYLAANNPTLVRRAYGDDIVQLGAAIRQVTSPAQCRESAAGALAGDCRLGDASKPATIALWGDSHADALTSAVAEIDPTRSVYRFIFHACPSILGVTRAGIGAEGATAAQRCRHFNEDVATTLSAMPEVRTVILVNNLGWYFRLRDTDTGLILRPDGFDSGDEALRRSMLLDAVIATARRLTTMGKRVVVLGAFYGIERLGATHAARELMRHADARQRLQIDVAEFDRRTAPVNDRLRALDEPGIIFVDPRMVFCSAANSTGVCNYDQGGPLLVDDGHFTDLGARKIAAAIRAALAAAPDTKEKAGAAMPAL